MIKKAIEILTVVIGILFSAIFLISLFPQIEPTKELFKNIGLLSTLLFALIIVLRLFKISHTDKINRIMLLPLILIGGILINGFWGGGDWKTQTILYEHGHFSNKTIEYQVKDNRTSNDNINRIIEKTVILNLIQKVDIVDTATVKSPWIRIDKDNI